MATRVIRGLLEEFLEMFDRAICFAAIVIGVKKRAMGLGPVPFHPKGLLIFGDGFVVFMLALFDNRQLVMRFDEIRFETQGFLCVKQRIVVVLLPNQDES